MSVRCQPSPTDGSQSGNEKNTMTDAACDRDTFVPNNGSGRLLLVIGVPLAGSLENNLLDNNPFCGTLTATIV